MIPRPNGGSDSFFSLPRSTLLRHTPLSFKEEIFVATMATPLGIKSLTPMCLIS